MLTRLFALIARAPGMLWMVLLMLALLVGSALLLLWRGEAIGARTIQRAAIADSVRVAVELVDTATRKSDRVVAVARRTKAASDTGRARRQLLLAEAASALEAAPPGLVELVHTDGMQIASDSVTIAHAFASIDTLLAERALRIQVDTLRVHQVELKPPDDGARRSFPLTAVVVTAAAVVTLLHFHR